ncbi:MAG: FKBP-type peptidyl-prolyl cis-trans isomerase N-terminal domain-containing protein [Arenimonas sp.]|jgi:peptidylprolyl isomerase
MKLRLLAASMAAFALSSGAVLAQSATPAPAAAPADKTTLSYAIGYDMGRDLAERKVDLDVNTMVRALQEGYSKKPPTMPGDKLAAALGAFQKKMAEQERANFERVSRENKAKSDAFLAANKAKPGVTVLPSGVQYRIIEPATGAKPTAASTVSVHLRGSISTGQEFANTYSTANAQPATFKLGEFPLAGVKEAILMMPVGSRWEVYIPADKAYGNDPRSPIGPGQAIVFDIKLVSSK